MKNTQEKTNNNDNDRYKERLGQRRRGEGALEEIAKEGLFEQHILTSSMLSYFVFIFLLCQIYMNAKSSSKSCQFVLSYFIASIKKQTLFHEYIPHLIRKWGKSPHQTQSLPRGCEVLQEKTDRKISVMN